MEIESPDVLDAFFTALAERTPCRLKLILTGGVEALLLGSTRPTGDLDFEITLMTSAAGQEQQWTEVEAAIAAASQVTEVAVQYSTEIDRWSAITMPHYRRHTRLYRRYGRVWVHLLEPIYWAVPKLTRYLDSDIADVQAVLRAEEVAPEPLARLCGRALRASPRSTAQFSFRRHVEHFFRTYGPTIWGREFDAEATVRTFQRAAGIRKA